MVSESTRRADQLRLFHVREQHPMFKPLPASLTDTEFTRSQTEARRLRASAWAEWTAAKARFKQELLGIRAHPCESVVKIPCALRLFTFGVEC